MKYLPFLNGKYTTAPGLTPLLKGASESDKLVFQIDEHYAAYLDNKRACRHENINKYYIENRLKSETIKLVNLYLVRQFCKEYPSVFQLDEEKKKLFNTTTKEELKWLDDWITIDQSHYKSLFDALCSQVQEDLAIVQMDKTTTTEYLAAIHLCSPNHWSPAEKIGKPFARIHDPVPGLERVVQNYWKMFESIISTGGPYTRFAWGVSTDMRLNHHPEPPPAVDAATWHGRSVNNSDYKFYIRTERQNLVGFPEAEAFLFTIRTYFYDIDTLTTEEKKALVSALESMSPEARQYKGLSTTMHQVISRLMR